MTSTYFLLALKVFATVSCSPISPRDLVIPTILPGSWEYQGCYNDVPGRTLKNGGYSSNSSMTAEACIIYCSNRGSIYAGTEYGYECFCGSSLALGAAPSISNTTACNMPCTGDATQPCGGHNLLNLFWSGHPGPQINPGQAPWSYVACYAEPSSPNTGRTLPHQVPIPGGSNNMTVGNCCLACQKAGYSLAGIEYSRECWCGDSFTNGGAPAPPTLDGLSGCSSLCTGNLSEYCGGSSRLNVYNLNNTIASLTSSAPVATGTPTIKPAVGLYSYVGCNTEGNGTRALTQAFEGKDNMSLELCAGFCTPYKYFGTEYGRECYCGNNLAPSSTTVADSSCKFVCPGDPSEYCGAGAHLSLYHHS